MCDVPFEELTTNVYSWQSALPDGTNYTSVIVAGLYPRNRVYESLTLSLIHPIPLALHGAENLMQVSGKIS